jgi:hypothetical protein
MDPFEMNQPLERYRLRSGLGIAAFASELGIGEDEYIRLVTGAAALSEERKPHIARRLGARPWQINECAPAPTPEQLAAINEATAHARVHGWLAADPETLELTSEILFELSDEPARESPPEAHMRQADALLKLDKVHRSSNDADYPHLRAILEGNIRALLGREGDAEFDPVAWAWETTGLLPWLDEDAGEV